jgi:hypothetical protein
MLSGQAVPEARAFELHATGGSETFGICSNPFLLHAFRTVEVHVKVTVNPDGTWGYDEDTVMEILGRDGRFHHTDRHTLAPVASPKPNPAAQAGASS